MFFVTLSFAVVINTFGKYSLIYAHTTQKVLQNFVLEAI